MLLKPPSVNPTVNYKTDLNDYSMLLALSMQLLASNLALNQ